MQPYRCAFVNLRAYSSAAQTSKQVGCAIAHPKALNYALACCQWQAGIGFDRSRPWEYSPRGVLPTPRPIYYYYILHM